MCIRAARRRRHPWKLSPYCRHIGRRQPCRSQHGKLGKHFVVHLRDKIVLSVSIVPPDLPELNGLHCHVKLLILQMVFSDYRHSRSASIARMVPRHYESPRQIAGLSTDRVQALTMWDGFEACPERSRRDCPGRSQNGWILFFVNLPPPTNLLRLTSILRSSHAPRHHPAPTRQDWTPGRHP